MEHFTIALETLSWCVTRSATNQFSISYKVRTVEAAC